MSNKPRLVSKAEFSRVAGVTPQTVNGLIKSRLAPALIGKKLDANHPECVSYLAEKVSSESGGSKLTKAEASAKVVAMSTDTRKLLNCKLSTILQLFGSVDGVEEWLKTIKLVAEIHEKQLKADVLSGSLISRKYVIDNVIAPINAANKSLISDGSLTITETVVNMVSAGSSKKEIRASVSKSIGRFIAAGKMSSLSKMQDYSEMGSGDD